VIVVTGKQLIIVVRSPRIFKGAGRLWSSLANLPHKRPLCGVSMKGRHLYGTVLIALFFCAFLFFCESSNTGSKLDIYGTVHVYPTVTPPATYPSSDFVSVIGPKDHVKVIKVVQKRNYLAVKVRLSDGREGWVFSGESIEVYKPTCSGPDFRAC
jgi:hypothetical protein